MQKKTLGKGIVKLKCQIVLIYEPLYVLLVTSYFVRKAPYGIVYDNNPNQCGTLIEGFVLINLIVKNSKIKN